MPILLAICLFQVEVTAKVTRPSAGAAASWPWSPLAPCPQDAPVRGPTCTTPYIKARAPKPSGPGTEKPRVSARFHRRQIKTPKGSLPVPKRRSPKPLFPRKTRAVHTTSRRGSQTKDRTYTGDRPQVPERGHQRALAGPWTHSHPWPLRTPPQNSRRELGVCRGSGPRRGRPAHQPGICSYGSLSGNFHHEAFQIERKFGKNNHRLDRSICLALLLHFMQKWPLTLHLSRHQSHPAVAGSSFVPSDIPSQCL